MRWFSGNQTNEDHKDAPAVRGPGQSSVDAVRRDVLTLLSYNGEVRDVRAVPDVPAQLDIAFADGQVLPLHLGAIHDAVSRHPAADRAQVLSTTLADQITKGRARPLTIADRARVLPVLRRVENTPSLNKIVLARFSTDVQVLFDLADPKAADPAPHYLTEETLQQIATPTDRLMELSIRNLGQLAYGTVTVDPLDGTPFSRIRMNGTHESSLMLHAPFWDSMAQQSGGVLAAVPGQNLVILAPDHTFSISAYGAVRDKLAKDIKHPLSPKLWRWTGDGWKQVAT